MKRSLRDAPLPTDARPTALRVSAATVRRPITLVILELGLLDEHGKSTAIGRHAPNLAGGCWNRAGIGWGSHVEGQAPIGPTNPLPASEALVIPAGSTPRGHFAGSVMAAFCGRARHGMERAENRLGSVGQRHGYPTAGLRRPGLMAPL
jgi:hypothetical protein